VFPKLVSGVFFNYQPNKRINKMRHKSNSVIANANAKKRTSLAINMQRYHVATYWRLADLIENEQRCKKCGKQIK